MNMSFKAASKIPFAVALLVAVSACGDSTDDVVDDVTSALSFDSFDDIDLDASSTITTYLDDSGDLASGVSVTDLDDVTSGSAEYSGFITGTVDDAEFAGTLSLDADFSEDTVDASATTFFHEDDGLYSGTLTGDGDIDTTASGTTPQVTVVLEGDLTNDGTTYDTSLALDGDFLTVDDVDATAVAGLVEGSVGDDDFDDGFFAVEE